MEDTTINSNKYNSKEESNNARNVNKTCESTISTTTAITTSEKVKIHLVAVGSAPLLKKNKFLFDSNQSFASIYTFLKKILKINDNNNDDNNNNDSGNSNSQSLYLYCNSAFIPSLDERIGDLNDCFSVRGELVVNYSYQEAWG